MSNNFDCNLFQITHKPNQFTITFTIKNPTSRAIQNIHINMNNDAFLDLASNIKNSLKQINDDEGLT